VTGFVTVTVGVTAGRGTHRCRPQPNPCPTHTQNISSSNLLSFQRKKFFAEGAPPSLPCPICHSLSPFPAQHFLPRHNWQTNDYLFASFIQ
jgi:hypothetical protein